MTDDDAKVLQKLHDTNDGEHIDAAIATIERLAAENARLTAEVERLSLVADMVELRTLMPDTDDGGRQIVVNLLSLRDDMLLGPDDGVAVQAVIVQDGLSFIHRLVREQTTLLGEKLGRLRYDAGPIAVREKGGEG